MPIQLTPTERYKERKAALSEERRRSLDLVEEEIAADPAERPVSSDPRVELAPRFSLGDGVLVHRSDFLIVSYRVLGPTTGTLLTFLFLSDADDGHR